MSSSYNQVFRRAEVKALLDRVLQDYQPTRKSSGSRKSKATPRKRKAAATSSKRKATSGPKGGAASKNKKAKRASSSKKNATALEQAAKAAIAGEVAAAAEQKAASEPAPASAKRVKKPKMWDLLTEDRQREINRIYGSAIRNPGITIARIQAMTKRRKAEADLVSPENVQLIRYVWREQKKHELAEAAEAKASAEDVQKIHDSFRDLKAELKTILASWGPNEIALAPKHRLFLENHSSRNNANKPVYPARAITQYIVFTTMNRGAIKEQHPDAKFGEVGKLVGKQWSNRSEAEKAAFAPKFEQMKAQHIARRTEFEKNVAAYVDSDPELPEVPAPPAPAAAVAPAS